MKDISGYEGLYAITENGEVWSYNRQMFLAHVNNCHGYLRVALYKNGIRKWHRIHRLVADAYIPNPNGFDTVDHIDGDKTNNNVKNLQWLSQYDNLVKSRPDLKKQRVLCIETGEEFQSQMDCARALGIEQTGISQVLRGRCKAFKGYHFERVE